MNEYFHVKLRTISIISTICVVFVHSYNLLLLMSPQEILEQASYVGFIENFISQGVTRIASPLFFMISGYLFFLNMKESSGWFLAKVKKRARTLLVPYLFWSMWGITIFLILQNLPVVNSFFNSEPVAGYSGDKLVNTLFLKPIPYQLWFVRDLMMLILVSPFIYYAVKHLHRYFLLICLVAWFFQVDMYIFNIRSLFFFSVGLYLTWHVEWITNKKFPKHAYLYLFIWIALAFIKSIFVFKGIDELLYGVVHKVSVIFGILAVWCMYDKLCVNNDASQLRIFPLFSFSFFIYTTHEPLLTIAKKVLILSFGISNPALLLSYLAAPFLAIILSVSMGYFLKRYLSRFYWVISGGR